ncbi:MAG: methyltransferase domain-containing protein [Asgard group archaeon]|nr:methyltransferase domain-containing protein [Asgard group archaeon]
MHNEKKLSDKEIIDLITIPQFPRSMKYDSKWIIENEMGSNCLWLMEALSQKINFTPNMRILDLGCGKALSSIFIAKEFGSQVWAVDPSISPTDNYKRIKEANVEDKVFPLFGDARKLPFPEKFFDTIVGINSYQFYGADDIFLRFFLLKHLKTGGRIGMIVPGFYTDFDTIPEHLVPFWDEALLSTWHSPDWYQKNLSKLHSINIELIDTLEGLGFECFLRWEKIMNDSMVSRTDNGRNITFVRFILRKK